MSTYGFIGTGNMGGALATAVSETMEPANIYLANRTIEKSQALAEKLCANVCDNQTAVQCDYVFLGVKPNMIEGVIRELKHDIISRTNPGVFVSMAAAVSIEKLEGFLGEDAAIVRIMPNTPVSVGEGIILYCANKNVREEAIEELMSALFWAGKCIKIDEKLMDAASAVAGCGPAFADLFMESLADGGVACGLPRALATELAAQMVLGSAKLLLESGKNPGLLKDEVCSPGGTTIQGVKALEDAAFRSAGMNAVIAAYEKTLQLAGKK